MFKYLTNLNPNPNLKLNQIAKLIAQLNSNFQSLNLSNIKIQFPLQYGQYKYKSFIIFFPAIYPITILGHILIQIFLQFITGLVGYWLIIWIECSLFNSHTLGITWLWNHIDFLSYYLLFMMLLLGMVVNQITSVSLSHIILIILFIHNHQLIIN